MHPTLATFATSYRHRFPDLTITAVGGELRLEWQEAPTSPCYTVTAHIFGEQTLVFQYSESDVRTMADPIEALVIAMNRERWWSGGDTPIIAAPGTFAALVLERRLLRLSARPMSPDRLN